MKKRTIAFAVVAALPVFGAALAYADCNVPAYELTLELDTLERLDGEDDLVAERKALGESAWLRRGTLTNGNASWEGIWFSESEQAP